MKMKTNPGQRIRRATSAESAILTRIVQHSSAYSGMYAVFARAIEITPEQIERDLVFVCEIDMRVAGFYSLRRTAESIELDFLFVENDFLRARIGSLLFDHMVHEVGRLGYEGVEIVAHPPAEAFYRRMGAVTIGTQPPAGRVTWPRPRMWARAIRVH